MGIIHFLNVKNGDCSIIQHATGRVSVIDVCNAGRVTSEHKGLDETLVKAAVHGNFNQKDCPVNPTAYLKRLGVTSIFRFILTHPDMDHMDGLHALYKEFPPANFWDTDNAKTMNFGEGSPYSKEDWCLYRSIRDGTINNGPKRLTLYAGSTGQYWSQGDNGDEGDGLQILAPTRRLVNRASKSDDYNDASYVILYRSVGGRVLFAGDSHDDTWDYILTNHAEDVRNVELLIAPHHGRKSGRKYEFLDVVSPSLTLFGNADSTHLAYSAWNYRELDYITNNQAGCVVVDTNSSAIEVYVSNKALVAKNPFVYPSYSTQHMGYHLRTLKRRETKRSRRSI